MAFSGQSHRILLKRCQKLSKIRTRIPGIQHKSSLIDSWFPLPFGDFEPQPKTHHHVSCAGKKRNKRRKLFWCLFQLRTETTCEEALEIQSTSKISCAESEVLGFNRPITPAKNEIKWALCRHLSSQHPRGFMFTKNYLPRRTSFHILTPHNADNL